MTNKQRLQKSEFLNILWTIINSSQYENEYIDQSFIISWSTRMNGKQSKSCFSCTNYPIWITGWRIKLHLHKINHRTHCSVTMLSSNSITFLNFLSPHTHSTNLAHVKISGIKPISANPYNAIVASATLPISHN